MSYAWWGIRLLSVPVSILYAIFKLFWLLLVSSFVTTIDLMQLNVSN